MCVACRQMQPKNQLIRIVKTPENTIKIDLSGKLNGRGAYLCKNTDCLAKCKKSKALERQLEIQTDSAFYLELENEIKK